jgi:hypothetical protein
MITDNKLTIGSKIWLTLVILVLYAFFFQSCSKKSDTTYNGPNPELIGTWSGTTSQNQAIKISVINVGDMLVINKYNYKVIKFDTGSAQKTKNYDVSSSTIVTTLSDTTFKFRPYGGYSYDDYLQGTFDVANMKLKGRFNTSFSNTAGTGTDSVVGSYTALKVK